MPSQAGLAGLRGSRRPQALWGHFQGGRAVPLQPAPLSRHILLWSVSGRLLAVRQSEALARTKQEWLL